MLIKFFFSSSTGTTGQTVVVTCNNGYTGGGTSTCGTNGEFNTLTCSPKTCTPSGNVANSNKATAGSITGTTGEIVTVECDRGYDGGGTATCGTDGLFNTLTCAANACTASGNVANSDKAADGSITGTTGEIVTVTCDAGYSGGGTATCSTSGEFNNGNYPLRHPSGKLTCTANICTPSGNVAHSNKAAIGSITDSSVAVKCDAGYSGSGTATCGTNGFYNTITCTPNVCAPSGNIVNSNKAAAESITGTTGETMTVKCNEGYTGGGTATCSVSGSFNTLTCNAVGNAKCDAYKCSAGTNKGISISCSSTSSSSCNDATCCDLPKATCDTFTTCSSTFTNKGAGTKCTTSEESSCDESTCCTANAKCDTYTCTAGTSKGVDISCATNEQSSCNDATCCKTATEEDKTKEDKTKEDYIPQFLDKTCAGVTGRNEDEFNCEDNAKDINASPAEIKCTNQTTGCTATECCTVVKTCAITNGSAVNILPTPKHCWCGTKELGTECSTSTGFYCVSKFNLCQKEFVPGDIKISGAKINPESINGIYEWQGSTLTNGKPTYQLKENLLYWESTNKVWTVKKTNSKNQSTDCMDTSIASIDTTLYWSLDVERPEFSNAGGSTTSVKAYSDGAWTDDKIVIASSKACLNDNGMKRNKKECTCGISDCTSSNGMFCLASSSKCSKINGCKYF